MGYPIGWTSLEESQELSQNQSERANRLKALGNAIVPQNAMLIGLAIKKELTSK